MPTLFHENLAHIAPQPRTMARRRIDAIRTSTLLAQYFFIINRPIEGRYHASSAATLALGAGLHRITPRPGPNVSLRPADSTSLELAPAASLADLGERIRVFWQVFFLDRCWSVALGAPSVLVDDAARGTTIDTPWPLESDMYEQVRMHSCFRYRNTV